MESYKEPLVLSLILHNNIILSMVQGKKNRQIISYVDRWYRVERW